MPGPDSCSAAKCALLDQVVGAQIPTRFVLTVTIGIVPTILIDAEEMLGRDPRLRRISKCIVDVGDPINLHLAVHMAVPVNMNI